MLQDLVKQKKESLTSGERTMISIYDFASVLASALVAIMVIFTFVFRVVGVVGSSMVPTLTDGDWLLVSPSDARPAYGQVVIITQPNQFNEPIVKRIIATEGQTIDIDFDEGAVYVDGVKLDEPYINNLTTNREDFPMYPVTVPAGKVFVMGDNRQNSSDSRSRLLSENNDELGFVDVNYILGVVKVRPFNVSKDPGTQKRKFHFYPANAWMIAQAKLTPAETGEEDA